MTTVLDFTAYAIAGISLLGSAVMLLKARDAALIAKDYRDAACESTGEARNSAERALKSELQSRNSELLAQGYSKTFTEESNAQNARSIERTAKLTEELNALKVEMQEQAAAIITLKAQHDAIQTGLLAIGQGAVAPVYA